MVHPVQMTTSEQPAREGIVKRCWVLQCWGCGRRTSSPRIRDVRQHSAVSLPSEEAMMKTLVMPPAIGREVGVGRATRNIPR